MHKTVVLLAILATAPLISGCSDGHAKMTEGDCIRFVEHYEDCMTGTLAGKCGITKKDMLQVTDCTDKFHTARDAWHAAVLEN